MKKLVAAVLLTAVASPAWAKTYTGTLQVAKVLCITYPCKAPVSLKVGALSYPIETTQYFTQGELDGLDGATVKMKGSIGAQQVPGGSKAMFQSFVPSSGALQIKGNLAQLYLNFMPTYPGPARGNMELTFGTDKKLLVSSSGKDWIQYNYHDVWLTGTLATGNGSNVPTVLEATKVKDLGLDQSAGSNVALKAPTSGVTTQSTPAGSSGAVGTTR